MLAANWLTGIIVALYLLCSKVDGSSEELLQFLRDPPKSASLDDLYQAVLSDQRKNYIEPIKSLGTRQVSSLNGLYDFCFDPDEKLLPRGSWQDQPLKATCKPGNFHRMPVPAAFNEILSNETAKNYMGRMWYQTVVPFPADRGRPDSNWLVQFGSINYLGLIWGQMVDDLGAPKSEAALLRSHVGGHLPIVANVSELVHSASPKRGLNLRLTIAVDNRLTNHTVPSGRLVDMSALVGHKQVKFEPDFDFFHFAGIMGDVQLIHLPRHYIKRAYVANTYQQTVHKFTYCIAGADNAAHYKPQHLFFENLDSAHMEPSQVTAEGECETSEFDCFGAQSNRLCQAIRQQQRWPNQRGATIRLRTFEHEKVEGNSKLVERDIFDMKLVKRPSLERLVELSGGQLQGFGMHHEQLFSGRTMGLPAIMKDLVLLKAMGANVLRTSHYPYSPAYLEACDELGIMVIAECPAVGLRSFSALQLELHKESVREMMLRDHEHPSIVMWSLANEPQSQKPEARAYFQQLTDYVRNELAEFTTKAGRPLTAAIAQSHQDDRVGDLLDIIMVNRYYAWYEYTGTLESIEPALNRSLFGWAGRYGKSLVLSEFGADTLAGMHSGELFSEQFQRDLIEEHERVFDQLAGFGNKSQLDFLGAMIWNFADFSTHESLQRVGGNKKGVFTADRKPKMAAESVKRIFRGRAEL